MAWLPGWFKKLPQRVGGDVRGAYKRKEEELWNHIQKLDTHVEADGGFCEDDLVNRRYKLEEELETLMETEELYWQQRGGMGTRGR
jgi:hypothetical protein